MDCYTPGQKVKLNNSGLNWITNNELYSIVKPQIYIVEPDTNATRGFPKVMVAPGLIFIAWKRDFDLVNIMPVEFEDYE